MRWFSCSTIHINTFLPWSVWFSNYGNSLAYVVFPCLAGTAGYILIYMCWIQWFYIQALWWKGGPVLLFMCCLRPTCEGECFAPPLRKTEIFVVYVVSLLLNEFRAVCGFSSLIFFTATTVQHAHEGCRRSGIFFFLTIKPQVDSCYYRYHERVDLSANIQRFPSS